MKRTRLKFYCSDKEKDTVNKIVRVNLNPVSTGSEENEKFWDFTPAGEMSFTTSNLEAAEIFEVGKEYYIDITKAGEVT